MGSNSKTIVWFRRDLRIEDNPALAAAAKDGCVLTVYIWCPKEKGQFYPGRVSRWWLKQSLALLEQSLKSLGAALVLIKAQSSLTALLECINATGVTKVVYNHLDGEKKVVGDENDKPVQKMDDMGIETTSNHGIVGADSRKTEVEKIEGKEASPSSISTPTSNKPAKRRITPMAID